MAKEDDIILKAINEIAPKRAEKVVADLATVDADVARLSESEINKLAETVALRLVDIGGQSEAPDATIWRERLQRLTYDLAIAITGSALYSALVYLANKAPTMLSGGDEVRPDVGRVNRDALLDQIVDPQSRQEITAVLSDGYLQEFIEQNARAHVERQPDFMMFKAHVAATTESGVASRLARNITDAIFDEMLEAGQRPVDGHPTRRTPYAGMA